MLISFNVIIHNMRCDKFYLSRYSWEGTYRSLLLCYKKVIKNVKITDCLNISSLTWWQSQKQFISAELSSLTNQLFSTVASSAGVERLFSTFGIVHSKLRNRLGSEKSSKLVAVFQHFNRNE